MLKSIAIKDFAIISSLEVQLKEGFNIFTGETGAGKSIVIEALGFVAGGRGDSGLIRHGAQKMSVSAVFASASLPNNLKQKYNITQDTFTVRRELDNKGKTRASVNNTAVLVADLAQLGEALIDFHGQHEHQTLFRKEAHLDILDTFAGNQAELKAVEDAWQKTQEIKAKIDALKMSAADKERTLDLYKYQLQEIEKLDIKAGEDTEIEAVLPKLKNAGKLKELSEQAYSILSEIEGSACELLAKAADLTADMAQEDASISSAAQELASARAAVQDIAQTLSSYKDNIDIDPQALDDMLSRQEKLRKIKLKYGPALEDVLIFSQTLKTRIADLESGEQNIDKFEAALEISLKKLLSLSEGLHNKRAKAAQELSKAVVQEIAPLGFEQVRFEVNLEQNPQPGPKGTDSAEFLFSSNPGQGLRPLRNIASGGEISRLMLGLKTVLAGGTPLMVFDEIDAGISGHTGKLVGRKLKKVSFGRQVLCVTHLAQVAVFADRHFTVEKIVSNNSTEVNVNLLEGVDKVREIARMIGSSRTASAGYKHAEDLLSEAQSQI